MKDAITIRCVLLAIISEFENRLHVVDALCFDEPGKFTRIVFLDVSLLLTFDNFT